MTADTIGSGPRPAHLRQAADVIARVISGDTPADGALRELFARNRAAGSRDRAAITALVYGVLRNYFPLRAALGENASAAELVAAQSRGEASAATAPSEAARHNLSEALWQALRAGHGDEASALAQSLNVEGTVDLRVNTLKASRETARAALREDQIDSDPIEGLAAGLRLRQRVALQRSRAFREGLVEPQDAGSQQLALFVAPAPGETVVDFCAGAGGKTLALGALMRNHGTLHAFDTSRARLARLAPRLARSGLSIVKEQVLRSERDPRLRELEQRADAVLVDVPCSGTGTLRRNPELRLRPPDLEALAATQQAILAAAARLVKPGGRLVYATCSVLRAENQDVVRGFLGSHAEFRHDGERVLLPHRDGTDGFYAARLISFSAPTPRQIRT